MKEKEKDQVILAGEEFFARAVALGMVVKRPPSVWYILIPGMFILEIFRRNAAVRQYSQVFLFPRRLALETARLLRDGRERDSVLERARHRLEGWLCSMKAFSERVFEAHWRQFELLLEHYRRLLDAEGATLYALIRHAYGSRASYEEFISRLEATEREIDEALAEKFGHDPQVVQRLRAEQEQVAIQRKKEVENLF